MIANQTKSQILNLQTLQTQLQGHQKLPMHQQLYPQIEYKRRVKTQNITIQTVMAFRLLHLREIYRGVVGFEKRALKFQRI